MSETEPADTNVTERQVPHGSVVVFVGIALLAPPIAGIMVAVHPFIWFAVGLGLIVGGASMDSTRTVTVSEESPRINCENCGARVPGDEPVCEYCDEPLPTSTGYQQTLDEWATETA
ncbi:hypothetical protein L593_11095 [Salinarchaeum sp. Harcht-Bsk1]|uniref:hypothetical protein n=1 Tax=Salinarchaeum sp. Harcht-Bsk1 TaxID=1333523 RepID=UPI0003422E04|nr:hypothetical protein [Salinarchaeum sp. Harcht-Bsk1]AGN02164.1 hypothetical protein L593_11095 [Salinarchaeum sp. Harcht-Bsk1]